jgi:YtkA-like
MTSRFPPFGASLLLAISAMGCSGSAAPTGPPTFTADAFMIAPSTLGTGLAVEVRTSPQPPARGTIAVQLTVIDATSRAPLDGLTIRVVPWMPAHDHGTSLVPTVKAEGQGKYLVSDVDLFMPGHWELQTTLSGPLADYVAPAFDVL